jgi:hypothetical protein
MRTHLTWLTAAVLAMGGLSGCSGSGDGDVDEFCRAFESMIQTGDGDITLAQGRDELETMAESAPEEIKADAETANTGYQTITGAVEDAGLELSTLEDPTALSPEDREKLAAAAADVDFDWAALNEAFANIEEWADQNC